MTDEIASQTAQSAKPRLVPRLRQKVADFIAPKDRPGRVGSAPDPRRYGLSAAPSARNWWFATAISCLVVVGALVFSYFVNKTTPDDSAQSDYEKLAQFIIAVAGFAATVAATIAVSRALTRPGAGVGTFARHSYLYGCLISDTIENINAQLHRVESHPHGPGRDEAVYVLRRDLQTVAAYALENIERWYVAELATVGPDAITAVHVNDYQQRSVRAKTVSVGAGGQDVEAPKFVVPALSVDPDWSPDADMIAWAKKHAIK